MKFSGCILDPDGTVEGEETLGANKLLGEAGGLGHCWAQSLFEKLLGWSRSQVLRDALL